MTGLAGCTTEGNLPLPEEIASLENLAVFPADLDPHHDISLTEITSYGDVDDVLLGSWISVAVDNQRRVCIADHQENVIHLYNSDGSYNRQIGRAGDGPGEFRQISQMRTDDHYLHVKDPTLQRITRFNIETFEVAGTVSVTVDSNQDGPVPYSASFDLLPDGNYLMHMGMSFWQGYPESDAYRSKTGKILDTISGNYRPGNVYTFQESEALVHREGRALMVISVPYKHNSVVEYHNGQIINGFSDRFLLKFYNLNSQYQRAVYYPFPKIPLDRNVILGIYADTNEQMRDIIRQDNMPENWPAFDTFIVDDEGRIWVKMFTDDYDTSRYVVLENSGELLAEFNWPRENLIQQIKNGFLYTIEENEDGLRRIVKYEITMT
ncbi:MAG: 6-bladed beta-propeller [Balneolaceae bacterium]|nr:6-bladed beta-propeller [Balneolaceae bacterium]